MIKWWEKLKARRRGEKWLAPTGARGRVFAKTANATLELKITRNDGTVEYKTVPADMLRG